MYPATWRWSASRPKAEETADQPSWAQRTSRVDDDGVQGSSGAVQAASAALSSPSLCFVASHVSTLMHARPSIARAARAF